MRFNANGPSIPDDLLVARDAGDVIFFCGAGVSRHKAELPDFYTLGGRVINLLGASEKSLARKLFNRIQEIGPMQGVGGLVATDRIFSLLQREFEQRDVQAAVSKAIRPKDNVDLSAHRTLIDLSRGKDGAVRLVTTNFDLLFEQCGEGLNPSGPPNLPNPQSNSFAGIVHLHGRVNADYTGPADEEFIVSSGDFGRAYLSDGWATRFMQSLLARFQIVFVGYTADDPPVQYLLEALNLHAGNRSRLFAFQPGSNTDDAALWEHRGVRAIPFGNGRDFDTLWDSLSAWADRARDVDTWHSNMLATAGNGPQGLAPHVRGQIAHIMATRDGANRVTNAEVPIPASWLLTFDANERYSPPDLLDPYGESTERIDPYASLSLDTDTPPQPDADEHDRFTLSTRQIPADAWTLFELGRFDQDDPQEPAFGHFLGPSALAGSSLGYRLERIGIWLQRVAHQPIALWWAAEIGPLHPYVTRSITAWLRQAPERWSDDVRLGWRLLIESWSDNRPPPNDSYFNLARRIELEGWSEMRVREYADIFRPRLVVRRRPGIRHPLSWTDTDRPNPVVDFDVEYPHPYELLAVPDEHLVYAIRRFRENLDLARSLNFEVKGQGRIFLQTTRAEDGEPPVSFDSYGVTGPVALFQQLMGRLSDSAPQLARSEIASWPPDDPDIFARLRIWAAAAPVIAPAEAADLLLGLPDPIFWSSTHQRDLLYSLRDRWEEFAPEDRARFEDRLLNSSFPWPEGTAGGAIEAAAFYRLDRLYWLSTQGVVFSFDLDQVMSSLQKVATDWKTGSGLEAAISNAPVVRSIGVDSNPGQLEHGPVNKVLDLARQANQRGFFDDLESRPFEGLAEKRPVRALAALGQAARSGDVPVSFWSSFFRAEGRKSDRPRMVHAIASRLLTLPPDGIASLAYPISDWLLGLSDRVFGDVDPVLDRIWGPLLAALPLQDKGRSHQIDSSWANDALNAPVGKLAQVLMKDPSTKGLGGESGLPAAWTAKQEQLLGLPGDLRRHALVILGYQITWLFAVDPHWTTVNLLNLISDDGDDADALWDGVLWAGRAPSAELYLRLKPGLVRRATSPGGRRAEAAVLAGFLLVGWGGDPAANEPQELISGAELRDILVDGDNDLRSQMLWHLTQWSAESKGWRGRRLPFLKGVWPNHRSIRTPEMSAILVEFALNAGDIFPEVVTTILPHLVPVRSGFMRQKGKTISNDPAILHPTAMLDLLWVILAEDPFLWPYGADEVIEALSIAPETRADPRLSELRRRRAS